MVDLGCAAGRVALHLQRKGFDVVGLDISPLALKVCRGRGLKKVKLGSVQDLRFPRNPFDTAILFGNNFGLLGSRAKAKRVLRRLHQIISQGGLILAETLDPYGTEDPVHPAYHRRNRKRGRLPGEIRMRIRYKQYTTPWFDWLLVSKDEMRTLVQRTGFKMTGSLDSDGPRYVGILQNI